MAKRTGGEIVLAVRGKDGEAIGAEPVKAIEEILKARHVLAEQVREYVRSQVNLWQLLPELALEADGKTGFSDVRQGIYANGRMKLEALDEMGYHFIWIDIQTGNLLGIGESGVVLDPGGFLEPVVDRFRLATDDEIILLISSEKSIQELDAYATVCDYIEGAEEKTGKYYKKEEQDNWRARTRQEYGLGIPDLRELKKQFKRRPQLKAGKKN